MKAAKRHCYGLESQADVYENGFKEGFEYAMKLLREPDARHVTVERGTVKKWSVGHVGPSLMAASLWADYLKLKAKE